MQKLKPPGQNFLPQQYGTTIGLILNNDENLKHNLVQRELFFSNFRSDISACISGL